MSKETNYLKLHLPEENEFYNVEKDQNENFEKIDEDARKRQEEISEHRLKKVSVTEDGHMLKEDKKKLDGIANGANNYVLPVASENILGGVKVGSNLSIANGVLSGAPSYSLPTASTSVLGGIKVGANLSITNGVLNGTSPYSLPTASTSVIGGVKVGANLSISNGVLNASVGVTTCFIPIGFILMTDDNKLNPATLFTGTTWGRIAENRNIRGATANEGVGTIGGSDTVGIAQGNLPAVNLWAHDHSHTRGGMDIWGNIYANLQKNDAGPHGDGAFSLTNSHTGTFGGGGVNIGTGNISFQASRSWTGATSGASTTCVPLGGSGVPLNVTNAFYKMHIWKRLS